MPLQPLRVRKNDPPLRVSVAPQQNLRVGNSQTIITPSPTSSAGGPQNVVPRPAGNALDFLGNWSSGTLSSAARFGAKAVQETVDIGRFLTPNFIPGTQPWVKNTVDPWIKNRADGARNWSQLDSVANAFDNAAIESGWRNGITGEATTDWGARGKTAGNVTGVAAVALPGIKKSVTDVYKSRKAIVNTAKNIPQKVSELPQNISNIRKSVDKFMDARKANKLEDADDIAIRNILNGNANSNRADNLRDIEKNQGSMNDADRLRVANGDTGQAGLQMGVSDREAMLARFRAQASGQPAPTVSTIKTTARADEVGELDEIEDLASTNVTGAAIADNLDDFKTVTSVGEDTDDLVRTSGVIEDPDVPRVPRGDPVDNVDEITDSKIQQIFRDATNTARPVGTTRVFQMGGSQGFTDWAFTNLDDLARYMRFVTTSTTPARFIDVPSDAIQATNRGESVVRIAENAQDNAEAAVAAGRANAATPNNPIAPQSVDEAIINTAETIDDMPQATTGASNLPAQLAASGDDVPPTTPYQGVQVGAAFQGDDALADATAAAQAARDAGAENPIRKGFNWFRRNADDPYVDAQRYDDQYAKMTGRKPGQLDPEESLTYLLGRSKNTKNEVEALLKQKQENGKSMLDLFKKYANKDDQANFMTYSMMRFDLEVRAKNLGKPLYPQYSADDLVNAVQRYELSNPDARDDALTLKMYGDKILDYAADHRMIDGDTAQMVKETYQSYVPLSRIVNENVPAINVQGGVRHSVGRQQVLQRLAGGDGTPLDDSFAGITQRAQIAVKQARTNDFDWEIARRASQGQAGFNIVQDSDDLRRKASLRDEIKEVSASIRSMVGDKRKAISNRRVAGVMVRGKEFNAMNVARRELKRAIDAERKLAQGKVSAARKAELQAKGKVAVAKSVLSQAERTEQRKIRAEAVKRARAILQSDTKLGTERPDLFKLNATRLDDALKGLTADQIPEVARTTVSGVRTQSARLAAQESKENLERIQSMKQRLIDEIPDAAAKQGVANLNNDELLNVFDMISEGDPKAYTALAKSLSKRQQDYNAIVATVDDLRRGIDEAVDVRKGLSAQNNAIQIDNTRNMAVITGQDAGFPFKVEIPMDLAKGLSQLTKRGPDDIVADLAQIPATVLKVLYTGAAAPVFTIYNSFIKNPAMMFTNAKGLTPFGARAIGQGFASVYKSQGFQQKLVAAGYNRVNATASVQDQKVLADVMASTGVMGNMRLLMNDPSAAGRKVWNNLNELGAVLDNMQRSQVGAGLYYNLKRAGVPEAEAMQRAAIAANEVMGNFQRVTQAARSAEPLILYSGATQAGVRSLRRAFYERPVETTTKVAALMTGAGVTVNSALSSPAGQEYYADMIATNKQYVLDGNLIFVMPNAKKNPETGEWTGVVRIGIAPDFRPLNRAVWQGSYENSQGGNVNPMIAATAAFDYFTGDYRNSIVDPETGFMGGNPVIQTTKTLTNVNPRNNEPLVNGRLAELPKDQQVYETSSKAARWIGDKTGISPIQADTLLGSAGFAGSLIQNRNDQTVPENIRDSLTRPFEGGFGEKDSTKYFNELERISGTIKSNDDYQIFKGLHEKKDPASRSIDKQAEKYKILLARPDVLRAEQELDAYNRSVGKAGNPFFDLSPEQQNAVMRYRGAKDLNAGKQAYAKDGTPLFTALGLDDKWYSDFRDAESAFYDQIKGDNPDSDKEFLTYSGAKKPQATPEMEALLNAYYALPKGTGARSAMLRAYPEILNKWAQDEQFTDAERVALGLSPLADDDSKGGGGGGFSRSGGGGSGGKTGGLKTYTFGSSSDGPSGNGSKLAKMGISTNRKYIKNGIKVKTPQLKKNGKITTKKVA